MDGCDCTIGACVYVGLKLEISLKCFVDKRFSKKSALAAELATLVHSRGEGGAASTLFSIIYTRRCLFFFRHVLKHARKKES